MADAGFVKLLPPYLLPNLPVEDGEDQVAQPPKQAKLVVKKVKATPKAANAWEIATPSGARVKVVTTTNSSSASISRLLTVHSKALKRLADK
jgi:hypothetical protein